MKNDVDIEISEAMIRAGLVAFVDFDPALDDGAEIVASVYRAMEEARINEEAA
jgi:hypothetical protein